MQVDPMTLTKGDLDEIGKKVQDTTIEIPQQFKQQYMQIMGSIQKDLHELHIQTSRVQVGTGQASAAQTSLAPRASQAAELVMKLVLCMVALREGSLRAESFDD